MSESKADYLYVLLADDDADDRMFFAEAIGELKMNIQLSEAKDGDDLMKCLDKSVFLPNILFLDLNMPFKNGLQCLREIRSNPVYNDICIVLYSTTARQTDIDEGFDKGANLFINKPNSFSELKTILLQVFTMDLRECHAAGKDKFVLKI